MGRPRKLSELELEQIKRRLGLIPYSLYGLMLPDVARIYKVSIRTLRRRLRLERQGHPRGRKNRRQKRDELRQLRS